MRQILFIFLFFALVPVWGQLESQLMDPMQPKELYECTLHNYDLSGPVRSYFYRYFKASYSNGQIQRGDEAQNPENHFSYFKAFTPSGYVESGVDLHNLAGAINFIDSFEFNAEGLPVKKTRYFGDRSVKYYESFEYTNSYLTRWAYHRLDRVQEDLVCVYSAAGKILSERKTDFYHPDPFDTYSTEGDTSNRVLAERFYEYDSLGRQIKRVNGKMQTDYFYSPEGKLEMRKVLDEEGVVTTQTISGDSLIHIDYTTEGIKHLIVKRFNPQGDPVETLSYVDGSLESRRIYVYTYDQKGNWISRCYGRLDSEYPKYWCDERMIEYYE